LAPEFSRAAKRLKGEDKAVPLAKVDSTAEKEITERFEVEGYPTLKFFIN
jgi:protein disulfide-isomerase A1